MYPVLLERNGQVITSWVVMALIGAWVAYFSLDHDLRLKKVKGLRTGWFFLGAVLSWFIGAYLGQSITVGRTIGIFTFGRFHFSGYVLYGGVIGSLIYGSIAWALGDWKKRIGLEEFGDLGAVALLWAMMFGRFGCTLYGCCYGTPAGNWPGYTLSYAHWDFRTGPFPLELDGVKLHPATLYEAFGILVILMIAYRLRPLTEGTRRRLGPGSIAMICWASYGVLRFSVEFIRGDPRGNPCLGLYPSQWIAIVTTLAAVYRLICIQKAAKPKLRDAR